MNVKCEFRLSPEGQRAALLAGVPAAEQQTLELPLMDTALISRCWIDAEGVPVFTTPCYRTYSGGGQVGIVPSSADELIAGVDARAAEKAALQLAREQADAEERAARIERDKPEVEKAFAYLASLDPMQYAYDWPNTKFGPRETEWLAALAAHNERKSALVAEREAADKAAKEARLAAEIEQWGGYHWSIGEAGMCYFSGHGLWRIHQTKRWCGVFTEPKGISRFCDSPRGEHTFDVRRLAIGECIQLGGYDTNSKGKRRYESEAFGVVAWNEDGEFAVRFFGSRAECFKMRKIVMAGAELRRKQIAEAA